MGWDSNRCLFVCVVLYFYICHFFRDLDVGMMVSALRRSGPHGGEGTIILKIRDPENVVKRWCDAAHVDLPGISVKIIHVSNFVNFHCKFFCLQIYLDLQVCIMYLVFA